jgi:hypothetical protein
VRAVSDKKTEDAEPTLCQFRSDSKKSLGLKYALPGWEEAESRRAADTAAEASCRSHASGSGDGGGLDEDSWGAGYWARRRRGSRRPACRWLEAARWGVVVAPALGAWTPCINPGLRSQPPPQKKNYR